MSSSPEACEILVEVEDSSSLMEIAPKQPLVLSIFAFAWVNGNFKDADVTKKKINNVMSALVASYKGTDAVTLLDFISKVLSRLDEGVSCIASPQLCPI